MQTSHKEIKYYLKWLLPLSYMSMASSDTCAENQNFIKWKSRTVDRVTVEFPARLWKWCMLCDLVWSTDSISHATWLPNIYHRQSVRTDSNIQLVNDLACNQVEVEQGLTSHQTHYTSTKTINVSHLFSRWTNWSLFLL